MKARMPWLIVIAMITGPLFGWAMHEFLSNGPALDGISAALGVVTTCFLRLVKMIIAPLVFATLSVGVARMDGAGAILRVGAKTLGWFIVATTVSLLIGMVLVQWFEPGSGLHLATASLTTTVPAAPSFKDMLEHVVPSSVIQAMANNEILQIVVFALLFGTAAANLGPKAAALIEVIEQLGNVVLKMTAYVMRLAPLAIFAALAASVLSQGVQILVTYAKFIAGFYAAIALLWAFLAMVLWLGVGARAAHLAVAIRAPVLLAFSTASSEAAYPQTLRSLEQFGVSKRIAAFVLPLGYSFNLDGSAMYCAFAMFFIAQIYGVQLSVQQQALMLLVLMVTSKGIAGVPRASLMVVASSLAYFGLPEQGLVFIIAVDHLLDMGRTATNVVGNAVAGTLVAKWEGELGDRTA